MVERDARAPDADAIRSQVEALGPWFHNLNLGGVATAPEHVSRRVLLFQGMLRGTSTVLRAEPDYPFSNRDVFDEPGYPKLHFVEASYAGDPSHWWIPNRACAEALLRAAGFMIEANPEPEVFLRSLAEEDASALDGICPSSSASQPNRGPDAEDR